MTDQAGEMVERLTTIVLQTGANFAIEAAARYPPLLQFKNAKTRKNTFTHFWYMYESETVSNFFTIVIFIATFLQMLAFAQPVAGF
jgi:hypothetical protein